IVLLLSVDPTTGQLCGAVHGAVLAGALFQRLVQKPLARERHLVMWAEAGELERFLDRENNGQHVKKMVIRELHQRARKLRVLLEFNDAPQTEEVENHLTELRKQAAQLDPEEEQRGREDLHPKLPLAAE